VKYSDNKDYIQYVRAYAQDDYSEATSALDKCLNDPRCRWEAAQIADLLRRKGDLLFLQGSARAALELYCAAEKADPDSLLVKCMHARFLLEKLGDAEQAIKKCEEIISTATKRPFPETSADFSSEYYRDLAEGIKSSALKGLNTL
jgi:tetratricopeptide (TPR) repeat protein